MERFPLPCDERQQLFDRLAGQLVGKHRLLKMPASILDNIADGRVKMITDILTEKAEHGSGRTGEPDLVRRVASRRLMPVMVLIRLTLPCSGATG